MDEICEIVPDTFFRDYWIARFRGRWRGRDESV